MTKKNVKMVSGGLFEAALRHMASRIVMRILILVVCWAAVVLFCAVRDAGAQAGKKKPAASAPSNAQKGDKTGGESSRQAAGTSGLPAGTPLAVVFVAGDDSIFADNLNEIAIAAVSQAAVFRLIGGEILTQLGASRRQGVRCFEDPICLRDVAREEQVSVILVGRVTEAADKVAVHLELYDRDVDRITRSGRVSGPDRNSVTNMLMAKIHDMFSPEEEARRSTGPPQEKPPDDSGGKSSVSGRVNLAQYREWLKRGWVIRVLMEFPKAMTAGGASDPSFLLFAARTFYKAATGELPEGDPLHMGEARKFCALALEQARAARDEQSRVGAEALEKALSQYGEFRLTAGSYWVNPGIVEVRDVGGLVNQGKKAFFGRVRARLAQPGSGDNPLEGAGIELPSAVYLPWGRYEANGVPVALEKPESGATVAVRDIAIPKHPAPEEYFRSVLAERRAEISPDVWGIALGVSGAYGEFPVFGGSVRGTRSFGPDFLLGADLAYWRTVMPVNDANLDGLEAELRLLFQAHWYLARWWEISPYVVMGAGGALVNARAQNGPAFAVGGGTGVSLGYDRLLSFEAVGFGTFGSAGHAVVLAQMFWALDIMEVSP